MSYHATQKDVSLGTAYSYSLNWDASLIFGCQCDPGFSGYDCSLRTFWSLRSEQLWSTPALNLFPIPADLLVVCPLVCRSSPESHFPLALHGPPCR
jgi:hypothetical protein